MAASIAPEAHSADTTLADTTLADTTLAAIPHAETSLDQTRQDETHQDQARKAQARWAAQPLSHRLRVLRKARNLLAQQSSELVDQFPASLARSRADSYAAEVIPLLDACRFLEREARHILEPRRLGSQGRPFWLSGLTASVERVPLGIVLIIGPANYPLFLPGVQALQALAAGNAVVWKPGRGGGPVAQLFAQAFVRAGLPAALLHVTGDSPSDGAAALGIGPLQGGPDKVFFTGSATAGHKVLLQAAGHAIPVVAELSGCDACIVLPSANPTQVAAALEFAMRFNGSATCMAPRRLFLVGAGHEPLLAELRRRLAALPGIELPRATRELLDTLLAEASQLGATVHGTAASTQVRPILIEHGTPAMRLAATDIMAPVLTAIPVPDSETLLRADSSCPFGLTASIFGSEKEAAHLAHALDVGTVVINDLIVPTADPRVPFGGRRASGFGVTRGAEGLLEMTSVKTTLLRSGRSTQHYEPTDARHERLFAGIVALSHAGTLARKLAGLRGIASALRRLRNRTGSGEPQ